MLKQRIFLRLFFVLPLLTACGTTAPPVLQTNCEHRELFSAPIVSPTGGFSATESKAILAGESEGVALLMIWRGDRALTVEWGWRPVAWSPVADILLVRQAVADHVLRWALVDLREGSVRWSEHLEEDRLSYDAFVYDSWSADGQGIDFFSHYDPTNDRLSISVDDYLPGGGPAPRSH